jgi:cellulose synthase/poly-beta-1,6-N-acetylglucosamine synthase-like glycosyltransferase
MFVSDALRKMVRHFVGDDIGAVTGVERIIHEGSYISASESRYWNYETKMKEWESKIHSTVGANGPIYALRRELFQTMPSDLNICDDMVISLYVVQKRKKLILDTEAIVLEHASTTLKEEWRRKVRISTQAWQTLRYIGDLLNPFSSPVAIPLFVHKVLRWLTLPLMMFVFISNIFIGGVFYAVFMIMQVIFYALSLAGIVLLSSNIKIPAVMTFLGYFLFTNIAQVVGLYNSGFNKGRPVWQPIERVD